MGKNKNKGFDLAKRQEKILKRMAKPLYKKSDRSTYFVITQPFGMHLNPAERGTVDVNRLASWISWVFRRDSVVEAVYTMSTKDEIVVRLVEGLDPTRMLGKHKYKNILNAGWPHGDPCPASCVFIYNYQSNGDPSDHSWREHIPAEVDTPPDHFRNPYPAPTWAVRPSYLSGLTLALPNSVPRSPKGSPEPPSEAPNHTRREEVKPGSSRSFYHTANTASESKSPSHVKVDHSNPTDPSITPGEPVYEPTQALRDQIASLNASRPQASVRVKQEPVTQTQREPGDLDPIRFRSETYDPPKSSIYASPLSVKQEPQDVPASVAGPSQALWDEWSRYQSKQKMLNDSVTGVNQELYVPQPTAQTPIAQSSGTTESFDFALKGPLPSFKKNMRDPVAGEDVQPWKRPKTEIN